MSKAKRKTSWLVAGAVLAGVAIVAAGVTFFFLATGELDTHPGEIQVDVLEGDYGTVKAQIGDGNIALLGTGDNSGQYVQVEGKEDLNISLSSIDLDLSPAFVDEHLNGTIAIDIDLKSELPQVEKEKDLIAVREGDGPYSYIEFNPVKLSVPVSSLIYSQDSFTYSFKDVAMSFSWGSFYEGMNPQAFYNSLLSGDDPGIEPTADNFDLITKELNNMQSDMKDVSITLQVSLSVTED